MFLGNLDDTDQKIITLLTENARMSYSDIGVRVGLSRVAVKSRIQALEERGIIEEYTTIINPQKISGAVSCYFEMEFSPDGFSESCRILKDCDIVTQIYQVSGRCRLHVHAVAASQEELESFLNETVFTLPGLSDLSCNIILSRIKDIKGCGCKKKDPGLPPESFFKSQMRSPSLPFFPEALLQIQPSLQHISGSSHEKRKAHRLYGQKAEAQYMEKCHSVFHSV